MTSQLRSPFALVTTQQPPREDLQDGMTHTTADEGLRHGSICRNTSPETDCLIVRQHDVATSAGDDLLMSQHQPETIFATTVSRKFVWSISPCRDVSLIPGNGPVTAANRPQQPRRHHDAATARKALQDGSMLEVAS